MPQRSWTLPPHVHAVMHDRDLVLLDLAADRYLCLPEALGVVRLDASRRGLEICDPGVAAELRAERLLSARTLGQISQSAALAKHRPGTPAASAVKLAYPPPEGRDLGRALVVLLDAVRGYWRRPLGEILRRGLAGRPPVADAPSPAMLQAVDSFHSWIPFAPLPAKCLLRAFLLLRWLARRGQGAHWVFGVATWPFRAHCWLQCGEVVLDDDAERVAAYSVILVL